MSTLLPPNSSPLERAVEAATALEIATPINTLWNPDECQANALPWLAWALVAWAARMSAASEGAAAEGVGPAGAVEALAASWRALQAVGHG